MEQRFILRGFVSGALGGLLAFAVARVLAEPLMQRAIDYENGRAAAEGALRRAGGLAAAAAEPEVFSRGVQSNAGLGVGMILFGVAMGGFLAVAYVLVTRCMRPSARPRSVSLAIAAAGFAGFFLLPFLKYPADPPGVEHAESIDARGLLYLAMVVVSLGSVLAAALATRWLRPRLGAWKGPLVALVAFAAWMAIVMAILPSLQPVQPLRDQSGTIVYPRFPADAMSQFRLYAVLAQAILWGAIGLAFGALAERLVRETGDARELDPRMKGQVNVVSSP
jgi:Probable cobalt transporter subunit (CbtA)